MKRELRGRRLLITGASSGIGRALTEQAVKAGARVAVAARSRDRLESLAAVLTVAGGEVFPIVADVTSDRDRTEMLTKVQEHFGGLDVLINNAGVGSWGHFSGSTEAVLREIMEVNFFGPSELIRLAIPLLERGLQPAIVNVSSMCGRAGMPAWPEYSASKFALCGLTETLRAELVRFGIDVLLIVPGLTRSNLSRRLLRNEGRMAIDFDKGMPPEEVAAAILNALTNNRAETVIGSDARWMLRMHRFFPRLLGWLIARRVRRLYGRLPATGHRLPAKEPKG